MSLWLAAGAGLFFAAIAAAVFLEIVRPVLLMRQAIRRMSEGDFRAVILKTRTGLFRGTARRLREISELLQQLERQRSDEGFSLRAILASMVEGVMIVDRSQRVRLANDALARMLDLSQSPINRTAIEVLRKPELQRLVEDALQHSAASRTELEISARDGGPERVRRFEVYAAGLSAKPGAASLGAIVVFHDITDLKELEQVRRELVANVSHEFRTPLSIINGYIETLLDGAIEDRDMAERSLRVMHKNGQRLTLLIEDLLTISKLEQRTQQLDLREMDPRAALDRVLERMESSVSARGAKIEVSWSPDFPHLFADSRRIEQIYTNLLENAFRYGPADGLRVRVSARVDGGEAEIRFADNGPGIPLADQPHLFERFYRVHKDRSRAAGGTGLGLSIVQHIAQAHGGAVALESEPGKGATFTVRLPLRPASPGTIPAPSRGG